MAHGDAFRRRAAPQAAPDVPGWVYDRELAISEQGSIQRIRHRLHMIEALETQLTDDLCSMAAPGSEAEADDEALAPYRLTSLVGHFLMVGIDGLRCARLLLENPDDPSSIRLPIIGHYAPLRLALESAAGAVWVLDSDNPHIRRERVLRTHATEAAESHALRKEMRRPRSDHSPEVAKLLRDDAATGAQDLHRGRERVKTVAQAVGVAPSLAERQRGWSTVFRDIDDRVQSPMLSIYGVWKMLSGLAHPVFDRATRHSSIEVAGEDGDVIVARYTADFSTTAMALDFALAVMTQALELSAQRCANPSLAFNMADIPPPPGWHRSQ